MWVVKWQNFFKDSLNCAFLQYLWHHGSIPITVWCLGEARGINTPLSHPLWNMKFLMKSIDICFALSKFKIKWLFWHHVTKCSTSSLYEGFAHLNTSSDDRTLSCTGGWKAKMYRVNSDTWRRFPLVLMCTSLKPQTVQSFVLWWRKRMTTATHMW